MKNLTLIDKVFILKTSQLFSQLDLELLLPIADKLQTISCKADAKIFEPGEEAHRMFFLVQGHVTIHDLSGKILETLQPPDFFGDEALFSEGHRAYQASCRTDVLLLALSQTHLMTIISECPSVAIGLLNAYASSTPFRFRSKNSHKK